MRYLWVVGLVAVLGLMMASDLWAQGGGGGGRGRAPAITLTPEQEAALAPAVAELKAAFAKLKEAATTTLGETNGPAYAMQVLREIQRAARPTPPSAPATPPAPAEGSTTP